MLYFELGYCSFYILFCVTANIAVITMSTYNTSDCEYKTNSHYLVNAK